MSTPSVTVRFQPCPHPFRTQPTSATPRCRLPSATSSRSAPEPASRLASCPDGPTLTPDSQVFCGTPFTEAMTVGAPSPSRYKGRHQSVWSLTCLVTASWFGCRPHINANAAPSTTSNPETPTRTPWQRIICTNQSASRRVQTVPAHRVSPSARSHPTPGPAPAACRRRRTPRTRASGWAGGCPSCPGRPSPPLLGGRDGASQPTVSGPTLPPTQPMEGAASRRPRGWTASSSATRCGSG